MGKSEIEWCDATWNPVTGCRHGCPYCYAAGLTRRFSGDLRANAKQMKAEDGMYYLKQPVKGADGKAVPYPAGFAPTFHEYRLDEIDRYRGGKNIFVVAMGDLFGEWVPDNWISKVIQKARLVPKHNYLFLTKNPKRYRVLQEKGILDNDYNFWYGATVTDGLTLISRISEFPYASNNFLSIEPLEEKIDERYLEHLNVSTVSWIIIGAETGKRKGKPVPTKDWIDPIVKKADVLGIPVFMKDSLIPIVGEENMRRAVPNVLFDHEMSERQKAKLMGECHECMAIHPKKEMYTISSRRGRGGTGKNLYYLCDQCYERLIRSLEAETDDIPEF